MCNERPLAPSVPLWTARAEGAGPCNPCAGATLRRSWAGSQRQMTYAACANWRSASLTWALAYASPEMEELVTQIEQALADVERELSDPDVSSDQQRMAQLGRRHKELSEQAALGARWRAATQGIADARGMLESEQDSEMRSYLEAELATSEAALQEVEDELRLALVERDPNDGRDVIIELRPGAGGDEAALFTGDIYRMLTEYAARLGYKTEPLSATISDQGGFREATFEVKGDGAYSVFKWESGVHRVQRVPETESQGRIHT